MKRNTEQNRIKRPKKLPKHSLQTEPAQKTVQHPQPNSDEMPNWGDIRTDLAIETHQYLTQNRRQLDGVDVEEERRGSVKISRVHVKTPTAAKSMGKQMGRYVTLDAPELRKRSTALHEQLGRILAEEIQQLFTIDDESKVFVVGLGNWNATPDALGPKVIDGLLITRHLEKYVPENMRGGLRSLCGVSPGVLGLTGIETSEIIRGIVERLKPSLVIAVDALASSSLDRILTTIQLSDTGLNPGAGVGNDQGNINEKTLGVPVLAIGVPTVVHASTIVNETLQSLTRKLESQDGEAGKFLSQMDPEDRQMLITDVLRPNNDQLMVTPKEIDMLVDDVANIISGGINAAIHPRYARQQSIL